MLTTIRDAIQNRKRLTVTYDPGERLIEPHAVGYSKAGDILLRAYQVDGVSKSGEPENWKLFRLDRMTDASGNGGSFSEPREGYKQNDSAMSGGIIAQL